eukprot:6769890-Pyramimonas_sp.AAC.1
MSALGLFGRLLIDLRLRKNLLYARTCSPQLLSILSISSNPFLGHKMMAIVLFHRDANITEPR